MTIEKYIFLIAAIVQIILAGVVFWKGKIKAKNISAVLILFLALWGFFTVFDFGLPILNKFIFFAADWMILLGFILSSEFPDNFFKNKRRYVTIIAISSLIGTLITISFVYKDRSFFEEGFSAYEDQGDFRISPFFLLFILYTVVYLIFSLIILYKKYKITSGAKKLQIKYLFTGAAISGFFSILLNFIMPVIYYDELYTAIGYSFTLIFSGFLTYSIIYNRIAGIKFVINKIYFIAILSVILCSIFFGVAFVYERAWGNIFEIQGVGIGVFIAMFFSIIFVYTSKKVEESGEAIFLKGKSPERLVKDFFIRLNSCLNLDDIVKIVKETLSQGLDIHVNNVLLVGETSKNQGYMSSFFWEYDGTKKIRIERLNNLEKKFFKLNEMLIKDEVKEKTWLEILKKEQVEIVCPFVHKNKILGVLFLSKIKSDGFSKEEIDFLQIISSRVAAAIDNALLYEQIYSLENMKSQFISMASHQLRTPITISRGFASILQEHHIKNLGKNSEDYLSKINYNLTHLNNIVNDILNISRIEGKRFVLNREKIKILKMFRQIISDLQYKAKEKKIGLHLNFDPKIMDLKLNIDEAKIFESIYNLVDNAINYTLEGEVNVSVKDDNNCILIFIRDTGIGISKKEKIKIFKLFSRLDNAVKLKPDGTGIGLYLTKIVIEKHKGKIWFESEEGKGTTFFVKLFKD